METIEKLKSRPGGEYSQKVSVYNYTTRPISLVNRLGIISTVKPQHMEGTFTRGPGIMVTIEMRGSKSHVSLDATCKLNGANDDVLAELQKNYQRGSMNTADSTSVNFWLPETYLIENGGVAYLPQVDLQVSIFDEDKIPPHPHTEEGRGYHNALDNDFFRSDGHSAIAVELIDNEKQFRGPTYVNILQQVFKLVPRRDTSRSSGIYITANGTVNKNGIKDTVTNRYISFADVNDTIGAMYRNYDEAVALATREQLTEKQRKEESLRAEEREHDLKISKHNFEIEQLEHKRIMERESRILATEKQEHERAKQSYMDMMAKINEMRDNSRDASSHKRKVFMEYLRMVPVALTVGLTVWSKMKK